MTKMKGMLGVKLELINGDQPPPHAAMQTIHKKLHIEAIEI